MQIDLNTLKTWALPWAVLLVLALGGLLYIGEGNFPWHLAGEVRELEEKVAKLQQEPQALEPPFQLPKAQAPSERIAEALLILEEARAQSGLNLGEIRPEEQLVKEKVIETPLALTAQGSVEALVDFIYCLQQDYPFLLIQRMRLGASSQELQVELKLLDRALLEVGADG